VSADSVVPGAGKPQSLNRFSYVYNNPLKHIDPSGHECTKPDGSPCSKETISDSNGSTPSTPPPTPWYQDVLGFMDPFIPTHVGLRFEGNYGFSWNPPPFSIGMVTGPGLHDILAFGGGGGGTGGVNIMCHTRSRECGIALDGGAQIGVSIAPMNGPHTGRGVKGGNIAVGGLIGWNAPDLDSALTGRSMGVNSASCMILCVAETTSVTVNRYLVGTDGVHQPELTAGNGGRPIITQFGGLGVTGNPLDMIGWSAGIGQTYAATPSQIKDFIYTNLGWK
jgi:hypothetical protein